MLASIRSGKETSVFLAANRRTLSQSSSGCPIHYSDSAIPAVPNHLDVARESQGTIRYVLMPPVVWCTSKMESASMASEHNAVCCVYLYELKRFCNPIEVR